MYVYIYTAYTSYRMVIIRRNDNNKKRIIHHTACHLTEKGCIWTADRRRRNPPASSSAAMFQVARKLQTAHDGTNTSRATSRFLYYNIQ